MNKAELWSIRYLAWTIEEVAMGKYDLALKFLRQAHDEILALREMAEIREETDRKANKHKEVTP